jgi:lipoate---protein ligase
MFTADLTFASPEENLACDEALLEMCEEEEETEILRFWEPAGYFVVLGYGNRVREEVNLDVADRRGVPILRRYSGGGTVVQGPGCLNYSLILRIPEQGPLSTLTGTTAFVMRRNASALQTLVDDPIHVDGQSDLTIGGRKFSGNAQRRIRRCLLFHGTILTDFDIAVVEDLLRIPVRQPVYRQNRTHSLFLGSFPASATEVRGALRTAWAAGADLVTVPRNEIAQLSKTRYGDSAWTFRR